MQPTVLRTAQVFGWHRLKRGKNAFHPKMTEHLSNGWEPLRRGDPSAKYEKEANALLFSCLKDAGIVDTHVKKRLTSRHCKAPPLFPLAKDHKSSFPDCKVRVVQPIHGSAIEILDQITSKVLTQVLPHLKHRVKSGDDFIAKCLASNTLHGNHEPYQASLDIESMYLKIRPLFIKLNFSHRVRRK